MEQSQQEIITGTERRQIRPEYNMEEIIEAVRLELIFRYGDDYHAVQWMDANDAKLKELMHDPKRILIEKLVDDTTREGAFKEIQEALNH